MQERYWSFLSQKKYELVYYELYFNRAVKTGRTIKIATTITSIITLGLWAMLGVNSIWYSVIIIGTQIISVLNDLLPYQRRVDELSEIRARLKVVYSEIEHNWLRIAGGCTTDDETNEIRTDLSRKWDSIENLFLQKDSLPRVKRLLQKADDEKNKYIENTFF